jgi:hypothetical protein
MDVWSMEWQWDEDNLAELARHRLDRKTVEQVTEEQPRLRRNKKDRAATHMMIGPDRGGRRWVVCIVQVRGQPGLWRAITGWRAEPEDEEWYRRSA